MTNSYRYSDGLSKLEVSTSIHAPVERCFDLARSVDVHTASTAATKERAVAGVTRGLIGKGETVTFRARQFGIWLSHASVITVFEPPYYFRDEMTRGFFSRFEHDHHFTREDHVTVMHDTIVLRSGFGVFSYLIDPFIVVPRLQSLLETRNAFIKRIAESEDWKLYLTDRAP